MMPFLDAILNEVKRAQFSYASQFPSSPKIERVILSGGGANLLGIEKYVADQLAMPVVRAEPLARFEYPQNAEPLTHELNPLLSVGLGLTLREFAG
jgi:Tfp pilus assembly PilM family ATPase